MGVRSMVSFIIESMKTGPIASDGFKVRFSDFSHESLSLSINEKNNFSHVEIDDFPLEIYINEKYKTVHKWFIKNERATLSFLKGLIKGSVAMPAMIMATDLPLSVIIPISVYTSIQAGAFQYFNPQVEKFLNGCDIKKSDLMKEGKRGALKFRLASLSRSLIVGVVACGLLTIVSTILGAGPSSLSAGIISSVRATLIGAGSRGMWVTTLASDTRDGIARNKENPEKQAAYQRKSNLIKFSLGLVSAFGGILTILSIPTGYWIQGFMGLGGLLYTIRSYQKKQRWLSKNSNFFNERHCCDETIYG